MNVNQHSKKVKMLGLGAVALLVFYLIAHHFTKQGAPEIPPPMVVVQKPQIKEMVEYVTQTGTTVAYNSVNLVARVEGYLEKIEFVDGTFVKKGQELFVIQPEPYWEQLKAAQATVAAEKAADAYNKSEYARQQRMYKQNATSLNEVEKWLAKTQEITAEIDKATAQAVNAAITYSYTHIASPFDGRIGRHLVDIGNLVGNGQATNLATVEQINPLYVYFNLNELDLIKLRAAARARGMKPKDINTIPIYISMQNENDFKYQATLDFINTGLNASTGTMELRALLPNKDYVFLPGLFVQVRIAVTKPIRQLTVPDAAILYDQIGPYVYVVDNNNKVVIKHIKLGSSTQGSRGVLEGIDAQDNVIIEGVQNASAGNKVQLQTAATESNEKAGAPQSEKKP
ncbi:MAG: efflux RND transporter periplasmic adaptor subunit [Legionella sp.]|uniref:efflux RND transporter periplasmic adaptor subunit n=1 Tax=Legionella sp. TaxID=459 RepID=UPI0039E48667